MFSFSYHQITDFSFILTLTNANNLPLKNSRTFLACTTVVLTGRVRSGRYGFNGRLYYFGLCHNVKRKQQYINKCSLVFFVFVLFCFDLIKRLIGY